MTTKAVLRKSDPFVKRSTLRYLTRGETPSVRAVALQLHFGMVTALREGDGAIHATWKEIAEWAGVSYASVKRAAIRLRELGWVRESPGKGITFNYKRSVPVEKAQIELRSNKELETLREECIHAAAPELEPPPDEVSQKSLIQTSPGVPNEPSKEPPAGRSLREAAVAVLMEAGADKGGAWVAVKIALQERRLDLGNLRAITAAVTSLGKNSYRPGALMCAAVKRPELGSKLIRDHAATMQRQAARMPQETRRVAGCPTTLPVVPVPVVPRWETMRGDIRRLLDFDSEDRAWVLKAAAAKGWSVADLRSVPELKGWEL